LIVVDNNSEDDTKEFLEFAQKVFPNLVVINNKENLGFAKANNLAAKSAAGKYLVCLNNDTIVQPGWLEALLEIAENDPEVGAVGSKLIFPDGKIQHAGVVIADRKDSPNPCDRFIATHIHYGCDANLPDVNIPMTYQSLTAASLLIRRDAFEKINGFDEKFWNGYEDVDLCFRLSSLGLKLVYQPKSLVIHYESQSGPERFSKVEMNVKLLQSRWIGKIKPDFYVYTDKGAVPTENDKIRRYTPPAKRDERVSTASPEKKNDTVSIIVLTYNNLKYNKEFINSLTKYTSPAYEIIVVDNASTDGTINYLKGLEKKLSNLRVIYNEANLGFPVAVNQAIKASKGGYMLIANNDIVVTEGWLERMLEVAESDPRIGIVGPVSNIVSGIQMDENAKYKTMPEMHRYAKKVVKQNAGQTLEYARVSFLCTLIKREVIDLIGGLDERFSPGNFEDDDFCIRSMIAGFKTVIAKDVFIHHYGSKSFRAEGYEKYAGLVRLNEKKFLDKWGASIDEIWLEKKPVKERSICFPVHQDEFFESYQRALVHFIDEEFEMAELALKRSVEIYETEGRSDRIDEYSNALNLYGNLYLMSGDLEHAKEYFERELKLKSDSVSACLGLGEVFFAAEMYKESKEMFEWAVRNKPGEKSTIAGLAKANRKLGLPDDHNSLKAERDREGITNKAAKGERIEGVKKQSKPKVSAIVSVYNSEKFIRGCLDDLLGQTLYEKGELEIVLVNAGSKENEDAIIREYKSKHPDIKYIKTDERETIYQAWNRGVKASSGKFITNANTDDRHRRDALEVLSGHLDRNEDVDLVYSDLYVT
ncbi:MAG TPA: glycosyltransferase, partial [Bacteroidales bacterium]|nr:glycosyltransferase [Bacteroidales bacterium]